jgi:nicotinate phosphoribosyltransferase
MKKDALALLAQATYNAINYRALGLPFVPPVQSLMDIDFYKFTMGQYIQRFYVDDMVTFKVIVRDKNIRLWKYVDLDELRKSLEHVQTLSIRKTDIYYLRGMDLYDKYLFDENYLSFLRNLRLSGFSVVNNAGTIEITFTAKWSEVTYWETIALAIISELYYRGVMKGMSLEEIERFYVIADNRLQNKLLEIKKHPGVKFADFGQRRRHSFLWQKHAVKQAVSILGSQFVGTSNTWMAFHFDLNPIGTNAHELPMVVTALADTDDEKRQAQYKVLKQWEHIYGQGLRIMLPDTYGSKQFFEGAPSWLKEWRGQRQDSGDPLVEGDTYMRWLRNHGADPRERLSIFSDGLDVDSMRSIASHFNEQHLISFGWGTNFTNSMRDVLPGNDDMRPFSVVCKVVSVNGRPCVKLSNDVTKATGPASEIAKYIEIFGEQDRVTREALV